MISGSRRRTRRSTTSRRGSWACARASVRCSTTRSRRCAGQRAPGCAPSASPTRTSRGSRTRCVLSATGISRALRSFSPRHQRAAPFDDGEENSLRTAHFCAPCAQKYTLARHQPSGLPRPVPLGRGSRREYFATYPPPRNLNFDFIRGLRAANSVRLNNSGRTPCYLLFV